MINNYTPAQHRIVKEYNLVFDDGYNNGFAFSCDAAGIISKSLAPEARENCIWCLKHPEMFERFDEVIEYRYKIKDPAHGTCHCGNEVYLRDEYYGACMCDKCGQWYNLSGQELLPPEEWQEDLDEDY